MPPAIPTAGTRRVGRPIPRAARRDPGHRMLGQLHGHRRHVDRDVALPAMKTALGLSPAQQQWVVDAYLIAFGGFLLLAARAGDLFGRKGVFEAGLWCSPPRAWPAVWPGAPGC
jgi:hypothetical protein